MKRNILFVTVLGAFSAGVHAQSSVTLYGTIDAGLAFSSNAAGSRQYFFSSGVESANRWGVTGIEDLGGGLRTIFTLESGYSVANGTLGQGGTFFGRQIFLGFDSNQLGTATLGRQYVTSSNFVGPFSAGNDWAAQGALYGAHPADMDNLDSTNRANNAIKYLSPVYGGFRFGGMYSLGGVAGDFTQKQIWSLGAGYATGPVKVGVGYLYVKDPNFSWFGNGTNSSIAGSNLTNPIISGFSTASGLQVAAAGASYAIGKAIVAAVYSNTSFRNLGSVAVANVRSQYSGNATFNIGELNLKYYLTPSFQLGVSYSLTDGSDLNGHTGARYQQVDLGADYFLSKRTDFYLVAVGQKASGTDSTGKAAVAAIDGLTASSNDKQLLVSAGIRQKF